MIDTSHVEKHLTQKQVITSQVERPLKQNMVDYVLKDILTMWTKAERPCVLVRFPNPLSVCYSSEH